MRDYILYDLGTIPVFRYKVENDKDCVFCRYCQVFWDYEHGMYMQMCDKGRDEVRNAKSELHTCILFEDVEL